MKEGDGSGGGIGMNNSDTINEFNGGGKGGVGIENIQCPFCHNTFYRIDKKDGAVCMNCGKRMNK